LLQTQTLQLPVVLRRPEFILQTDGHYFYSYRSPTTAMGVGSSLRLVLKQEGVKALWKGNLASCLHRFPYSGTIFCVQDFLKTRHHFSDLTAGAVAGSVAATAAYPLDLVKTRMATDQRFSGVLQTFRVLVSERGFLSLYRGLVPTLVHVAPSLAISFGVYGHLKRSFQAKESWQSSLLCGSISGLCSSSLLFPVDLLRRRMQLSSSASVSLLNCLNEIHQRHGLRGFYRGLTAELLKVVPYVGVLFMTAEIIKTSALSTC
jgi:hypothetical protein